MANEFMLALPIIVGLLGVGLAIFDRGWREYVTAKRNDPTITHFSADYMVNLIVTAGGVGAFFGAVIPLIIGSMTALPPEGIFIWTFTQIWGGYTSAYTILDKLNTPIETKTALRKLREAVANGDIKVEPKGQPTGTTAETKF